MSIRVLDIGARYGIHPSFIPIKKMCQFYLVEPDADEASRLKDVYRSEPNVTVLNQAFGARAETRTFYVREHKALSGFIPQGLGVPLTTGWTQLSQVELQVIPGDQAIKPPIDFLKVDTEGFEIEVLSGLNSILSKSVLGMRIELYFTNVVGMRPTVCQLFDALYDLDFRLVNLDYAGVGHSRGPIAYGPRRGILESSDGIFIRKASSLDGEEEVVKTAIFLCTQQATDVAISLLLDRKITLPVGSLRAFDDSGLAMFLRKRIAHYLKGFLGDQPWNLAVVQEVWYELTNEDFPEYADFYRKFPMH